MFPLILGLLAILGLRRRRIAERQTSASPAAILNVLSRRDAHAEVLTEALRSRVQQSTPGLLGGANSILGLLWSGSSLFTGMEFALGRVIGVAQRNFIRQRAMALVMTTLFIVAIVVTIGINSLIALPGIIWGFEPLAGLVVWSLFMLAIYRLVPNRTHRVRELWPGMSDRGRTAMELLTLLWPVLTRFSQGVPRRTAPSSRWSSCSQEAVAVLPRRVHPPRRRRQPHARRRAGRPARLLGERHGHVECRVARGSQSSGGVSPTGGLTYHDCEHHGNHLSVHRHDLRHRP